MERKEFLNLVGISVGAVILQNCMSGCSKSSDPSPAKPSTTTTSTGGTTPSTTGLTGNNVSSKGTIDFTIDLGNDSFKTLQTNGKALVSGDVIVARTKTGDFLAVAKACTHEGATIEFVADNSSFKCNNHGSVFDANGSVSVGPATSALKKYTVTFDKDKNTLKIA